MRKIWLFGMTIAAAAAFSGPASASHVTGVVVGSANGTLLVAGPSGTVRAVSGRLAVGTRVDLDGTRVTAVGRTHTARIHGVVLRKRGDVAFLAAASHVVVVHGARNLASAGTVVDTTVGIDANGDLDDQGEQEDGEATQVPVQATVAGVSATTVSLTVNGQTLTIPLPAGLVLPSTLIGTTATLNVSFGGGLATADLQGDDDQGEDGGGGHD